jgi:hypothetical protein
MTEEFFKIAFDHNGLHYEGRVSPEHKDQNGIPKSYHVVLNDIFFGYVSMDDSGRWHVTEQRPEALLEAVVAGIEKNGSH